MLSAAVRDLPERCRQVVTLRLLYGLSQKEIYWCAGGFFRAQGG